MQRWGYGCNNFYKTCHVTLEEGPWWSFLLMDVVPWICDHIPSWRLPFLSHLKVVDGNDTYDFWEWHGDLQQMFCANVDLPLINWAYGKRIKTTCVKLSWEEGKRLFYDQDKDHWEVMEADPEFGKFAGMTVEEAKLSGRWGRG